MVASWWMWAGFAVFMVAALALDLRDLRLEGGHVLGAGEALRWTIGWVVLALVFCALLWGWLRGERIQWGAMKRNASWQQ